MSNGNKPKSNEYHSLDSMLFKLREMEFIEPHTKEWELRLQFIESHIILAVASGQGWLTIDGEFTELRQGHVYLCRPGQLIEAAAYSLDERGLYMMRFDVLEESQSTADATTTINRKGLFPVQGEVILASPVSVNALCENIFHSFQDEDPLKRFGTQISFHELLHTILQEFLREYDNDAEASLDHIKSYIEQHYRQELTIEHLAKVAGISSRHFMRLFKKTYGCGAIDYLAMYRIKEAQRLMRTGGPNRLQDIARHVGYQDDIYFRRKFKQITGVPPATFMRNSRQKIAAYHFPSIGQLIALQITPCAAPADHPWTDYYKRKYQSDTVVALSADETERREQLQLAKPDFIIGVDIFVSAEEQTRLQEIAPSFFVPWLEHNWRDHLRLIAKFLDKSAAAEAWLDSYERKALFVREEVKQTLKNERLLILQISGVQFQVLGDRSLGAVIYEDLRVRPAVGIDRMNAAQEVRLNQLPEFEADRLLLIVGEDALSQSSWRTLLNSEIWRGLKAVINDRIDILPAYPWVEYTAFTHELLLDEVLKLWRYRA
ncbi:helix-turn-helix domain-containing protein [Paenibacillus sp. NPDC058174]|uniref:helix-turn-helix domain-containing protein n=1 Tax=Paenibacillus sp. NPDC058174 TaxID=3346366 RepID=UPI0036DDA64E